MVLNGRAATNAVAIAGVIDGMVASVASGTALRSARPCPTCACGVAVTANAASIPVATVSKRDRIMDALLWLNGGNGCGQRVTVGGRQAEQRELYQHAWRERRGRLHVEHLPEHLPARQGRVHVGLEREAAQVVQVRAGDAG